MVKVLKGQPLYMAKHIRSQITHEDIDAEPFIPPKIKGYPCISVQSIYQQLVNVSNLGLSTPGPAPVWFWSRKLDYGSFIFDQCPDYFGASYLYANNIYIDYDHQTPYTTKDQLRQVHWHTLVPQITVRCSIWTPIQLLSENRLRFETEYFNASSGVIHFNRQHNNGLYSCSINWTFSEFDTLPISVHSWNMPYNSLMWVSAKTNSKGQYRDINGNYHDYP